MLNVLKSSSADLTRTHNTEHSTEWKETYLRQRRYTWSISMTLFFLLNNLKKCLKFILKIIFIQIVFNRIQDLELAVDRMKQQQEHLAKRLKDESDKKAKFENELQKELQRVTALEIKNEQQQKILRRKNEEIASAKRRLRNGSACSLPSVHG